MIEGSAINPLVRLFETRGVVLFHACQLLDFQSYLKLGGIPSRNCLVEACLPFTPFETDETDKTNDVWDKVFVNLSDFGETFAGGGQGTPNPYGPILIQLRPEALLESSDIAISLKSAGAPGFNREKNALKTCEDVGRLFEHPVSASFPERRYVKRRKDLRVDFQDPNAADPEISCYIEAGIISLNYTEKVIADPYIIQGKNLLYWAQVERRAFFSTSKFPIYERRSSRTSWPTTKLLYSELANYIMKNMSVSLQSLSLDPMISAELRRWASSLTQLNLEWQFRRFAKYLDYGTLKYIYNNQSW